MRDQTQPLEEAIRTLDPALFNSRREYLAVKLAAALADRPFRVTDEQIEELKQEFTDEEILEMVFACATFSWGNILGIGLRVEMDTDSAYPQLDWRDAAETKRGMLLKAAAEENPSSG